ncbi:MAG: hypothetical protein ACREBU_18080, partial [Nitrososphaera sp.]
LYNEIDSDVRTFDTVDPEAVQYPVQAGSNSRVELTEFGASMDFGDVVEDGIMYVSECTTSPVSVRFLTMDACLRISPAFQMVEGSSAIVNMSFAGLDIPNGYGTGDIDMFHEVISPDGSTTVIDITAKRGNETIIGNTTSFSNFILAVALHDEKPPGAHRSQIFVGVDNVVNLRDVNDQQNSSATVTVSFGKSSYGLSEDPVLTISDANGNVDPANNDIIYADVMSETSDPFFITVTLTETGPSTGNFQGSFGLTSGASSTVDRELQAATGDKLSVDYISGGRFSAEISGVAESGVVDLSDYLVEEGACFVPIGGAVNLQIVDSSLSSEGLIRATLSYANAILGENDPSSIILVHREDGTWNDIRVESDLDGKTVSGETRHPGPFSLATDFGTCGGGAGGGFGRGLIVDAVASVAASSGGSSGGSGGGGGGGSSSPPRTSSPSAATSVQLGDAVNAFAIVPASSGYLGGQVTLNFEQVISSGSIT